MISTDKGIFDEKSEVRQRIIEYGRLAEKLDIVVFNIKNLELPYTHDREYMVISENVRIYPTNSRSRWFYLFDAIKIGKKIEKPDLVTSQDPFECGLAGWRLAKYFSTKLQLQVHTDFLNPYFQNESLLNKIRVKIAKFLIPKADCIRVVSKRIKDSILAKSNFPKEVGLQKIEILPVFVDVEKIKNEPIQVSLKEKYPQFDFIILMASRLTKEKNIGMATEAMEGVVKSYPRVGLIIVGVGPEKANLKFKIKNLKLDKNVIMESWMTNLSSYYKTADLFLLTSNYEGYGMTVVEAVACGCPVIMTDVGLAGDVLESGYGGKVIPVGGKKELEDLIKSFYANSDLRDGLLLYSSKITDSIPSKTEYLKKYKKHWEDCLD
ncbi:glycosyltransferase [Patescibacteria group bacterium]|nr:glycosyltransferase [Patescibacteria group bacterium]